MADKNDKSSASSPQKEEECAFYRIRFRKDGQEFTAESQLKNLLRDDAVMVKTDHGLEPPQTFWFRLYLH